MRFKVRYTQKYSTAQNEHRRLEMRIWEFEPDSLRINIYKHNFIFPKAEIFVKKPNDV